MTVVREVDRLVESGGLVKESVELSNQCPADDPSLIADRFLYYSSLSPIKILAIIIHPSCITDCDDVTRG